MFSWFSREFSLVCGFLAADSGENWDYGERVNSWNDCFICNWLYVLFAHSHINVLSGMLKSHHNNYINLPTASLKKITHFTFWGLLGPQGDLWSGCWYQKDRNNAICLLKVFVKFTITSFWGPKRPQKEVGRLKYVCHIGQPVPSKKQYICLHNSFSPVYLSLNLRPPYQAINDCQQYNSVSMSYSFVPVSG